MRQMGFVFIIGLLLWGWAEISAFIYVSNQIGGILSLLGVFLTAIIGISFLKNQGLSVVNRVRSELANGHPPIVSIADSVSLVVGGGLMLIPGYVTDFFGVLLFIPRFRTMAGMYILQWVAKQPRFNAVINFGGDTFARKNGSQDPFGFREQPRHQNGFDDVIEGEFEERPDTKPYTIQKKGSHHDGC